MPSCTLNSNSLLLTPNGWAAYTGVTGTQTIFGIDRSGKLIPAEIKTVSTQASADFVFIGSTKACGVFSSSIQILDAHGQSHRVASVIDTCSIADLRFENASGTAEGTVIDGLTLWEALSTQSVLKDSGQVSIRCRQSYNEKLDGTIGKLVPGGKNSRMYYVLDKSKLLVAVAESNVTQLISEVRIAFTNEEHKVELPRAACNIATLIASTLSALGKEFCLTYDAIQHTSFVFMHEEAQKTVLGVGRCAQRIVESTTEHKISWAATSWSPLVNGFIVVSD
jgi:hypothetical protein